MKPLMRLLVSLLVVTVLVAGTVMLIRNSNGDYSGDYALSGLFAKAGEGLQPGSEVVFRGYKSGGSRPWRFRTTWRRSPS